MASNGSLETVSSVTSSQAMGLSSCNGFLSCASGVGGSSCGSSHFGGSSAVLGGSLGAVPGTPGRSADGGFACSDYKPSPSACSDSSTTSLELSPGARSPTISHDLPLSSTCTTSPMISL